jgi:hypothetical protein
VPLRLQRRERVAAERELAVTAALRRPDVTAPVAATDDEAARDQVDVVPAQCPQFADAQPGAWRQGEHRSPLRVGRVEEPLGFLEAEKSNSGCGPFIQRTLGTCESSSQSTATESALRSMVRWLLSDFGLSPEASFFAL